MDTSATTTQRCGQRLLTYLAFAILGLANTVLPFVIFSANYLTVPYPRWLVVLIETLPALAVKLLLPHVLHHVPYWMRPVSVAACWIVAAIVTKVVPPNVPPPVRVLMAVLASSSAAATDVSVLGMLRYYGRVGLAGWGAGTGAGAVLCAVLPFVLTVWMGSFLRSFIEAVYCLAGAMLVAYFVILPRAPMNYPPREARFPKKDLEHGSDGSVVSIHDLIAEMNRLLSPKVRLSLTRAMVGPYMLPLFIAFAAQALSFPGVTHALPVSATFDNFFSFSTMYGLLFQLGVFVSRAATPLAPIRNLTMPFLLLGVVTAVLLLSSLFLIEIEAGLLALATGLVGGTVYMSIMTRALDHTSDQPEMNREFSLQVVGAGDAAGSAIGGIVAAALTSSLCQWGSGDVQRWCQTSR